MERKLSGLNLLFLAALLDQPLGQLGAFAISDHPTRNVTAKNIEDDVQVEVRPFRGAEKLGYIPTPKLIGSRGQQFRLLVGRMRQLIAALANLTLLVEQAIHGANRAVILPFIEQRRINSGWRTILETLFM